jgi:hypothetical protein
VPHRHPYPAYLNPFLPTAMMTNPDAVALSASFPAYGAAAAQPFSTTPESQSAFHALSTPLEQAQYSIPLFLSHYFLDGTGQPAPSKTPYQLTLTGLTETFAAQITTAANRIPGLWCRVVDGDSAGQKTLYIGWALPLSEAEQERTRAAAQARHAAEDARAAAEYAAARRAVSDEHAVYLRGLVARAAVTGGRHVDFNPTGKYMIDCPAIEKQWYRGWNECYDGPREMELHVTPTKVPGIYEAWFNFRVVEGAMLLGTNRTRLVEHRNALERHKKYRVREQQWKWNWDCLPKSDTDSFRQARQRPMEQPNPRRFWVLWQGIQTGEGGEQPDMDNNHTGCIEFSDGKFVAFQAEINLDIGERDDMLYGKKVSDVADAKATDVWTEWNRRFN